MDYNIYNFENLEQTVNLMFSDDYKDRFKAEYIQLKIRLTKLENMVDKYYNGTLDIQLNCDINVLTEQLLAMYSYLQSLEKRAKIEGITF